MAIKSASATFTRFFVPELKTDDFWSYIDERLREGAFADPRSIQNSLPSQ